MSADPEMRIIHSETYATLDGSEVEQELTAVYCGRSPEPMTMITQRLGGSKDTVVLTLGQLRRLAAKLEAHAESASW